MQIAFTIIKKVTFSLFCRFLKEIPPLSKLKEECELLKQVVDNMETRIVLCHNDLLWTNIIYDEKSGKSLLVISYDSKCVGGWDQSQFCYITILYRDHFQVFVLLLLLQAY